MQENGQKPTAVASPAGLLTGGILGRRRPLAVAVLADLLAVTVFVLVGRHSHHEALSVPGLAHTAWPFVAGVAVGHLGVALIRWPVLGLRAGAGVLAKTVLVGLVLRAGVAGDGTPLPFVIVTILVLSALILGWRLAWSRAHPRSG